MKNTQRERLQREIAFLKDINKNESVQIKVGVSQIAMQIDPEILIKEKESELENLTLYIDRESELETEIDNVRSQLEHLKSLEDETVVLYQNGVPFDFLRSTLINDVAAREQRLLKEKGEIKTYFETGKHVY